MNSAMQLRPVATDDYGNSVYRCRFTDALVWPDDAKIVGATVPGVKARYVMENSPRGHAAKLASDIAFHESEANCNTCKHLIRVGGGKDIGGLMDGHCAVTDTPLRFCPDDPMHMPCHESRYT